jgi:hypothetical protein
MKEGQPNAPTVMPLEEFLSEAAQLDLATNHDYSPPTPKYWAYRSVQPEMLFGVNNDVANQCFRRIDA